MSRNDTKSKLSTDSLPIEDFTLFTYYYVARFKAHTHAHGFMYIKSYENVKRRVLQECKQKIGELHEKKFISNIYIHTYACIPTGLPCRAGHIRWL